MCPSAETETPATRISNETVRLVHEYTGRGPTQARTAINKDLISVVLQDTLTKGERSLVAKGRSEVVLTTRREFQSAMREDLVAAVEKASGRKVLAFLSDNHIDPDVAVESFVLEPQADPAAPVFAAPQDG